MRLLLWHSELHECRNLPGGISVIHGNVVQRRQRHNTRHICRLIINGTDTLALTDAVALAYNVTIAAATWAERGNGASLCLYALFVRSADPLLSTSQPTASANDNITASFTALTVQFVTNYVNGQPVYQPFPFLALGPTSSSVTATAGNGASLTLTAGSNVSLVITAANGTLTCSITGGVFPYVALLYGPAGGGAALAGCNSSTCSSPNYIWYSAAPFTDATGCTPSSMSGPGSFCASTCALVNSTDIGSNPTVYLTSSGTWYNAGNASAGVVFAGFPSAASTTVSSSPPPSPPPAPTSSLTSSPPPAPPPSPPPPPLSISSLGGNNTNVSAVTAQVTSDLVSLSSNASALASKQESILTSLTSGLNTSTILSSGNAAAAASLVLAVVSAAPNVTLSPSSQSAALSVLSAVASAPINVSGAAGVAVMSALSSIAGSASTNNPGALTQVTGVLDSLAANAASSLLSSLASGGAGSAAPASVTFSTPNIQAAISVTPPGTVNTASISAPGSPSSFNPMPPGLLSSAGSAAVITNFRSLAFDPYGNTNSSGNGTAPPASNLSTVGGVTRLAFSTANGTLEVANATTPITFTLPLVSAAPGSLVQGVCSFYDTVAQTYSTNGCIGVPNPGPPGHTLAFVSGYQTPTDASLAMAWSISGPLLAGCNSTFVDCSLAKPPVIYPDPRQPLAIPAVSCPANATKPPVLRVFFGTHCQLWQPNNALNCSWDNTKQAFVGSGCVATGNVTQCMCRHLTDFAAARAPVLTTCSLSDMLSLNPADIVTKLRMLFIVVITIFGVMNLGAGIGAFLDAQERRNSIIRLTKPSTGFLLVPLHSGSGEHSSPSDSADDGVWTWSFEQQPLMSPVESPRGSGPTLALAMSLPYFRLRLAIPEELCAAGRTLGEALGRQDGLSVSFLNTTYAVEVHDHAFDAVLQRRSSVRIPTTGSVNSGPRSSNVLSSSTSPDLSKQARMAPTALVMAFITVSHALSIAQLARRKADAAAYFRDVRIPGCDHDFEMLMRLFMGMLGEGNLSDKTYWVEKARLWRLLLLQRSDGSFVPSHSLATALQAHASDSSIDAKAPAQDDDDVVGDILVAGAPSSSALATTDDPLAFSSGVVMASMPKALYELGQNGVDVQSVWVTVLAQSCMEEFDCSWLASDEEDPNERTAVDAVDAWLRAQGKLLPALGDLLSSGRLQAAAERTRERWDDLMEAKVGAVRRSKVIQKYRMTTHAQRASAVVVQSLMTQHDQFSTFLDTSASMQRWQRWMILLTLVIEALLISIWFYQSRSAQCCAEMRAILNCESQTSCLGFTGSCADLQSQFSTLQGPFTYGIPPSEHADLSEYECHAFPDDAYPTDQLLVGLISFAVAIPVAMFLARCFEIANENDDEPEAWLEMPDGVVKYAMMALFGRKPHGEWHYEHAMQQPDLKPCDSFVVRWYVRRSYEMPTTTLLRIATWLWNSLRHGSKPAAESADAGEEGKAGGEDTGDSDALIKRLYAVAGLVGVYLCWAIFSWFIFTYGMLIYRQMGDQAQKKFASAWGVNFGINSAGEWQDVLQAAVQAAVIVVILDLLSIMGHGRWLEGQVDFLSVQATLFGTAAKTWFGRTSALVKQQMRLT